MKAKAENMNGSNLKWGDVSTQQRSITLTVYALALVSLITSESREKLNHSDK